ncbi:MAG: hypothetical protein HOP10_04945 [Chitinophagaceae bacterium]|nr:hypothetical protein [Chitinophagaceae bacterium]
MIFDWIKSTIENIKERVRNPFSERNTAPFAGAFIIALLIYNWHLFFSLINFDSSETRLTKIEIIKGYLREKNWVNRIGMPVVIAFGSIVFYYFFNTISLGITTIFNRWFKATILYFTDRSKIIPRKELEQNITNTNKLRERYESIRKIQTEFQGEIEDYRRQLNEKDSAIIKIREEKERTFKELEVTTQKLEALTREEVSMKILLARYGKNERFEDVTKSVAELISSKGNFNVENAELGTDPIRYFIKQLFIIYQSGNEVKTLLANESERIELKDHILIASTTERSEKKQKSLQNQKKLANIFKGEWILKYSKTSLGSERVIIDDEARYFANGIHSFHLNNIQINDKQISFNKVSLKGVLHAKDTLTIITDKLITGSDTLGYKLEYSKPPDVRNIQ